MQVRFLPGSPGAFNWVENGVEYSFWEHPGGWVYTWGVKVFGYILIALLSIPIWRAGANTEVVRILELFVLGGLIVYKQLTKNVIKGVVGLVLVMSVGLGTLLNSGIVTARFDSVDTERLVFGRKEYVKLVEKRTEEAVYLPYKLRVLVGWAGWGQVYLTNIWELLSVQNWANWWLVVNLPFALYGLVNKKIWGALVLIGLLSGALVYQPDTLTSWYLIRIPVTLGLIWGWRRSRLRMVTYLGLSIVNLLLLKV